MDPVGGPAPTLSGLQITTLPTSNSAAHLHHQETANCHHNSASPSPVDNLASGRTVAGASSSLDSACLPSASATSPRNKGIRAFSYLKNYTQHHLRNRESNHTTSPKRKSFSLTSNILTRSVSHSAIILSPAHFQHQQERASPSPVSQTASDTFTPAAASTATPSIPETHPETQPARLPSPNQSQVQQPPLDSSSSVEVPGFPFPSTNPDIDPALSIEHNNLEPLRTIATLTPTQHPPNSHPSASGPSHGSMTRTRSATESSLGQPSTNGTTPEVLPSIRFSTYYDPRATRPSLTFTPIARTLPIGNEVIRVGRYSERDNQPGTVPNNAPSAAPVGFKSKVVSRRHCEFWYESGKWYVKDVKSSSGTFLNHIRLSPPGTESRPYAINDGDIIQLGIDFKGGEDMIFRCVKMRLELNRGWQNKLNSYNMGAHKRLRNMTKSSDTAGGSTQSSHDCSICLNTIAPCQCLFVAPCSHTWHFKCIRSLLNSPSYPIFICPNCRAAADLEAEVEDPEDWEKMDDSEIGVDDDEKAPDDADASAVEDLTTAPQDPTIAPAITTGAAMDIDDHNTAPHLSPSHATSTPLPIPTSAAAANSSGSQAQARTPPPQQQNGTMAAPPKVPGATNTPTPSHEGPITPRNDAGPWVFDGSGVRTRGAAARASSESSRMRSLDRAAAELAQVTSG